MPAELLNLQEQLANLQVLLTAAMKEGKPAEEIGKLQQSILVVQKRIIERQQFLRESSR